MAEDRTVAEASGAIPLGGSDVNVTLRLKVTKPFERDGKWFATLIAYLSRDSKRPIPNQPLFVHRNGVDAGVANPKTKSQGQFSCDVELPGTGEYVLTVGVFETDLWAGVTVNVPTGPAAKSPEELELEKLRVKVAVTMEKKKLDARLAKIESGDEEESTLELKALDPLKRGDEFMIPLRRQKADGSVSPGKICFVDWHQKRKGAPFELQVFTVPMPADREYVQIMRQLLDGPRKAEFFLPEDRTKKVLIEIPAKIVPKQRDTTASSVVTPVLSPFERGKNAAHRLFRAASTAVARS